MEYQIPYSILVLFLLAAAIALAFRPFRFSQRELPVFFRAHIFVPCLFVAWVSCGNTFTFSPYQLKHVLPDFLLGADDWGTGNIYTFMKLADEVALLVGYIACARFAEDAAAEGGFAKRVRLCRPHLLAAAILHASGVILCDKVLLIDVFLLFPWLCAGFAAVAGFQALAEKIRRRWPLLLAGIAAAGWLFVPVACFRP